jgi:hypothetical protein
MGYFVILNSTQLMILKGIVLKIGEMVEDVEASLGKA